MKRIILLVNLILFGMSLQAQNDTRSAPKNPTPGKVGYANVNYIMSVLPDTKRLDSALTEMRSKFQADFDVKRQNLQALYTSYIQNRDAMADSTRARMEGQIQAGQTDLQQFEENAQTTLQNTQKLYMAPIYLQVGKAIEEVAIENGFYVILPTQVSGQNIFLYADAKRDVSSLILQKFGIVPDPPKAATPKPTSKTKKP